MKLIRLRLHSDFRGLKNGFSIEFPYSSKSNNAIEPYCLVGLNGSGKSNVLELLSEIFFYLETFSKSKNTELNKLASNFGFEIEYSLPRLTFQLQMMERERDYDAWTEVDPVIKIKKLPNEIPSILVTVAGEGFPTEDPNSTHNEKDLLILPQHIIGYSSGMNELISNAFVKMDFHYVDEFNKLSDDKKSVGSLDVNRMFFMDYESNKLITLCNFLFDNDSERAKLLPLRNELQIDALHSFSIDIRLQDLYAKPIKLPSELSLAIDGLMKCSTTKKEVAKSNRHGEIKEYRFDYWVNEATKQAFKEHFKTPMELYKQLYFLRLLNLHLIGKDTHSKIKKSEPGANLSALLPKHEENKLVFNISNIALKKRHVAKPIYYKQLSDGEHQFLHVLGAIVLMDKPGTLFILDEPETHFNPEWRSKFVSLLNSCLDSETDQREQEVFLTTHSPFVVSDCKPEKVFIFSRDDNRNVYYEKPTDYQFNTYGASTDLINLHVFKKKESIAEMARKKLDELKQKIANNEVDQATAFKALMEFGDSFEKMLVIKELRAKEVRE